MRNILVAIVIAMLSVSMAAAQSSSAPKPDKATSSNKLLPVKGALNACAAFGSGFVKVDGSDTCVKIGGAVSIGVDGAVGSH